MSTVRVGLVSDSHGRFECLSRMADSAPDVAARKPRGPIRRAAGRARE